VRKGISLVLLLGSYLTFCLLFPRISFFRTLEYLWGDSFFVLRGSQKVSAPIVVVAIDEPSFKEIDLPWPWPRSLHARLISALRRSGAKAIGFDILFAEPSEDPREDQALARALKQAGNVVLGMAMSTLKRRGFWERLPVWPLDPLARAAASLGVVNFFPEEDGIIRRARLKVGDLPSLAAAVVSIAGQERQMKGCPEHFFIDFKGIEGAIPVVSYYQALEPEKYLPRGFFKGRIVLVGLASEAAAEVNRGAVDAFPTPYFRLSRKLMFGVEIHAQTVATLLEGCPLRSWPSAGPLNILIFLGPLLLAYSFRDRPWRLAGFLVFSLFLLFSLTFFLFLRFHIIYTPLSGALAFLLASGEAGLYTFAHTAKERTFLKKAFSLYVPSELVSEIVKHPELLRLGGERREITILFSDIRNFTTISEQLDPEVLTHLLNAYFSRMTREIFGEGGTLDKFIGDAIMALFGAPLPFEDHASRACRAALRMTQALQEIIPEWKKAGVENFNIGIGLNTGLAIVGNLGSEERFDYTAIGDAVNLASRLEGLCKIYKVSIICSEYTVEKAGKDFFWRELDYVVVKGKVKPIRIYELKLEREKVDALYEEGLYFYREGRFREALRCFQEVLALDAADGPAQVMKERCAFLVASPPSRWRGVWEIKTK